MMTPNPQQQRSIPPRNDNNMAGRGTAAFRG